MTREEAISLLTQVKTIILGSESWLDSTHQPIEEAFNMAIEALKSNTPNALNALDCVSRAQALNNIRSLYPEAPRINFMDNLAQWKKKYSQYMECEEVIKRLPSAQQWIPVSERLPKDIKPVIVTWKNTDPHSYYQYIVGKHYIGTAHYKNGKWFWYSSVTEDLLAEYGRCDSEEFDEAIEVISWMPLPKPYKEERRRAE